MAQHRPQAGSARVGGCANGLSRENRVIRPFYSPGGAHARDFPCDRGEQAPGGGSPTAARSEDEVEAGIVGGHHVPVPDDHFEIIARTRVDRDAQACVAAGIVDKPQVPAAAPAERKLLIASAARVGVDPGDIDHVTTEGDSALESWRCGVARRGVCRRIGKWRDDVLCAAAGRRVGDERKDEAVVARPADEEIRAPAAFEGIVSRFAEDAVVAVSTK